MVVLTLDKETRREKLNAELERVVNLLRMDTEIEQIVLFGSYQEAVLPGKVTSTCSSSKNQQESLSQNGRDL